MAAEMLAFANEVAESIRQAKRGESAAVHTTGCARILPCRWRLGLGVAGMGTWF
jgi:hypothetical protein